ncbi:hypothetical protein O1L60_38165 [Streptomyces diastatochromogenes]|nr:hypothetical protein [Streptomyces diastatochromogenes]
MTLYEAVEGVSPFLRDTWTATADAVRFEEAPPMRGAGRLEPLISALLAKDPEARPTIAEATALLKRRGPSRPRTPTEVVPPPETPGAASPERSSRSPTTGATRSASTSVPTTSGWSPGAGPPTSRPSPPTPARCG